MIKVTAVKPLDGYQLELTFNNGEIRVFDVRPYLHKEIFTELRDVGYFRSVRIAFGSVAWPNEQDFGPESLYVESRPQTNGKNGTSGTSGTSGVEMPIAQR